MSIIESVFDRIVGGLNMFIDVPEVARYVAIEETLRGVTLPNPENPASDRHFTHIDAPGLIPHSLPVLFFTTRHTGRPRFSLRINSTHVVNYTFADDGLRTWHKFIPPGVLKTQFNELVLDVREEGEITFADIVILYKSNELTVRKSIVSPPVYESWK